MREKLCCLGLIYESILGITILSRTRNALILPLINTNMLESLYIQCLQQPLSLSPSLSLLFSFFTAPGLLFLPVYFPLLYFVANLCLPYLYMIIVDSFKAIFMPKSWYLFLLTYVLCLIYSPSLILYLPLTFIFLVIFFYFYFIFLYQRCSYRCMYRFLKTFCCIPDIFRRNSQLTEQLILCGINHPSPVQLHQSLSFFRVMISFTLSNLTNRKSDTSTYIILFTLLQLLTTLAISLF